MFRDTLSLGSSVALFLLLFAAMLSSAQTTSRVTGVVRDASGALISGAQVTLTDESTKVAFTGETTSAGTYVFDAVKPGTYTVKIAKAGFKTFESNGNVVTIGQPTALTTSLQVGVPTETMVVSGAADLVQTATSGNIGNLVDSVALNTLPIVTSRGRNTLRWLNSNPVLPIRVVSIREVRMLRVEVSTPTEPAIAHGTTRSTASISTRPAPGAPTSLRCARIPTCCPSSEWSPAISLQNTGETVARK